MQRRELAMSLKQLGGVMQRRQFCRLAGGALVLIPAGLFLVRCGGGRSDQTAKGPTNQPSQSGTKLVYTSNVVGNPGVLTERALEFLQPPREDQ